MNKYKNANEAFKDTLDMLMNWWVEYQDTIALFNWWFEIKNPLDNHIDVPERKWSLDYAEYEWQWYLSWDRSIKEIWERAKIWKNIADENWLVNSNYGYQWMRADQLEYIIKELQRDPYTRRACITIYDWKEHEWFGKDTPCTYCINFYQFNGSLNMNVLMRSNDIWFWFCNDQYCFSKLLEMVALRLWYKVWKYFHFANNMHLYSRNLWAAQKIVF